MSRRFSFHAALLLMIAVAAHAQPPDRTTSDAVENAAAGHSRIIDLSYPLNEDANYWPGDNYKPFQLKTIATLEKDGVLSKAMTLPEHIGTHLDAPNHFESDRWSASEIPPENLFGPGVMIDITPQVETNPDYGLTVEDITTWEDEHGRIPDGAIVLLKTGWGRFWDKPQLYQGRDVRGGLHFPSYTGAAATFLVEQRTVRALGVDTLSIDRGISQDFAVHHILGKANRYGIENVAYLDQLQATGFTLVVAPMKIDHGTGGPTRIFAIAPEK